MTDELSQKARSLIRDALAEEQRPSTTHRDRLRRRVLARAAAGGVVTLVGSSVANASARSLFSVVVSSLAVGFGAGLVLVGAAQVVFNPSVHVASKPERPAVAPRSLTNAMPRTLPEANDLPPEAADMPAPVARFGAEPASSVIVAPVKAHAFDVTSRSDAGAGSALRAELDLMAQIQEALRDARGERALDLIARYDALHRSGVLETERLAAEVFAACQVGDVTRAGRAAQRFLARDGSSALAMRVKKACPTTFDHAR